MQRKFLEDLGIKDKETIDKILDENSTDIGKAKGELETVQTQLTESKKEVETLKGQVSERDGQLETLKKSTGDIDELKKQIETLQTENKANAEAHAAEIKQMKIDAAIDAALSNAKAKNNKAVKALLNDLDKFEIDENGNIIDGDKIIAIISRYLKEKGRLSQDTIVATVMSNLGLHKYAEQSNLHLQQTQVGDRYVLEEMLKDGFNLGGEQSGHVILLDYNPTGDGILTSLMLIKSILEEGKKASELGETVKLYPQVLINSKVNANKKYDYDKDKDIKNAIEKLEKEFAGNGRVLIRPSGTEPLVRVMIEGEEQEYITKKAKEIAKLIEEKLK